MKGTEVQTLSNTRFFNVYTMCTVGSAANYLSIEPMYRAFIIRRMLQQSTCAAEESYGKINFLNSYTTSKVIKMAIAKCAFSAYSYNT